MSLFEDRVCLVLCESRTSTKVQRILLKSSFVLRWVFVKLTVNRSREFEFCLDSFKLKNFGCPCEIFVFDEFDELTSSLVLPYCFCKCESMAVKSADAHYL